MSGEKIIGRSYAIKDAALRATGQLKYVGDMKLPNMLHAKLLLSTCAHAEITGVDISEALKVDGVKAIATCFNTPDTKYNSALRFYEHNIPFTEEVFPKTVRFVGDRVAAVAAETLSAAEKAVKLIKVDYKELPAVFDVEEAIKEGAVNLHPGGNIVTEMRAESGNVEEGFAQADQIFEDRYETPPIHHSAMETHAAIAHFDYNDKLTVYSPCQNIFAFRILLSQIFNMPMHKIRVITPAIGGAFGGKLEMVLEPVVAILSKMTRRPVKLVMNRSESMLSTRTRHGSVVYLKTGVKKDGTLTAQEIKILLNTGAYASSALNVLAALSHKVFKVYEFPNMKFYGAPVYTNLPIAGAMRGYGSPQIFFAQQCQMNKIANAIGMDVSELQLKNVKSPDGVDARFNSPVGNPRIADCITKGKEIFGWDEKKKLPREENGWLRGLGMAVGSHGNGVFGAHRDPITLMLKLNEDGTVTLLTGVHEMGNGVSTMQVQMIAEVLGVEHTDVETLEADTDACGWNLGDYASRGVFVEGGAAKYIAESLADEILEIAAEMLSASGPVSKNELTLSGKFVFSKTEPDKRVSLSDVAVYSQRDKKKELTVVKTYHSPAGRSSYGVHFAEVLVNKESGKVKVVDYAAVHDVGRVINPVSIEGQLEGAIQMGIGYALTEGCCFDEKGRMTNDSFNKYKMPRSNEMPKISTCFIEAGEPDGPFGAKSIGECATVPVAPAVCGAVENALGIEIHEIPVGIVKGMIN